MALRIESVYRWLKSCYLKLRLFLKDDFRWSFGPETGLHWARGELNPVGDDLQPRILQIPNPGACTAPR